MSAPPTTRRQLVLPWPPSVNHYWRHALTGSRFAGRRIIAREGIQYRERAILCALTANHHAPPLTGRLRVLLEAFPPDGRVRDLDNLLKPALDALVHARVILDDGLIDDLRIVRTCIAPPGRLVVTIEPLV